MKIRIDTQALVPINKEHTLRGQAITALVMFKERGHEVSFHGTSLDEHQLSLLAQENITGQNFDPKKADISISANNQDLLLTKHSWEAYQKFTTWSDLLARILSPVRKAELMRVTNETEISVNLNIDGTGKSDISTGLGFFDHMLDQIAKHGHIDLDLKCKGDLHVDEHHTIEDVALALGESFAKAVGDKRGIGRYGFVLPMDESQAVIAIDLSGRPYLEYEATFSRDFVGDFPTNMTKHFFYSLAMGLKATLHISVKGENDHHKIEAIFKGVAKCLRQALDQNEKYLDILPSSKGSL